MNKQEDNCIFINVSLLSTLLINYASVSIGELEGDERGETLTSWVLAFETLRGFLKFVRQRLPFVEMEH